MIVNKLRSFLVRFDHILLLVSLLLFVCSPIWDSFQNVSHIISDSVIIFIIISGLSVTYSHAGKDFRFTFYFGVITAVLSVIIYFLDEESLIVQITQLMQVFYFLLLTIKLFGLIINAKVVSSEVLINSVSGYLLIGLMWSIIVIIFVSFHPGSFSFSLEPGKKFLDSMYYVFVTLTTLGYGDLLPITRAAKSISIMIAISGSFYTTIVLGMIVGKYISAEASKNNKD